MHHLIRFYILDFKEDAQLKKKQIIPIIVFLTLIYGISIWTVLKPDTEKSETENRYLAKMPEFSKKTFFDGSFGKDYETYLSDQFILRNQFMELKTRNELLLQKRDINDVYIAKDHYLIRKYNEESFDMKKVSDNVKELGTFVTNYAQKMGKNHVKVMMVPTAAMVLKEKLPSFAQPYDETKLLDKIKNVVPNGTFLDATESLEQHKSESIYYKTDHHWNALGAYYGYVQWAKAVNIQPYELSDLKKEKVTDQFFGTNQSKLCYAKQADEIDLYRNEKISYEVLYDGLFKNPYDKTKVKNDIYVRSHLTEKDKYLVYLDGNHPLVDIKTSVKNGKKLLVIKDSYAHCMLPYLLNHFEQVTVVDTRYYNNGISTLKPDEEYTDILVLRNTAKFMLDDSTFKLNY